MTSDFSSRRFSTPDAGRARGRRLQRQNSCQPSVSGDVRSGPSGSGLINLFRRLRSSSSTQAPSIEEPLDAKPSGEDRTIVRNIYRRPSRRGRGKPKVSSVGETRRREFASRNDAWTDAEDSEQEGVVKSALVCTTSDTSSISRKPSSLRRPRSRSMPAVANRPKTISPQATPIYRKQTSFCDDVEVIYFDEEGSVVSNLSCQSEKLKSIEDDEDDCYDINKNCLEGLHGPVRRGNSPSPRACSPDNSPPSTLVACCLSGIVVNPKAGSSPLRGIRIKIDIDAQCIRSRTKVKVLSSGTSVLVMTYKEVSGELNLQENVERINLPLTIDPYSVKAQVKSNGSLVVEAPIRN